MRSQPMFYKNIVAINKQTNGDWGFEPSDDYSYTSETNSLYIAAVEFIKAASEYPIVFCTADDGSVFPVVVLGLRKDENLYVNDKGEWLANYIPAYVRRYPFILAKNEQSPDQFTVCMDSSCLGFNTDGQGRKLFDDGVESEWLKKSVSFLEDYQKHIQLTVLFCNNIKEYGILESMQANAQLDSGEKISLGGFMCINREKLKKLNDEILLNMVKTDQMELVYAHLTSLPNIEVLRCRA